jgi:protein TonB
MTINTQKSFLISSFLHLLFIVAFIVIPKPDYTAIKHVIDISFLFSNIENETQTNKKREEKTIIKSKSDTMKTEKIIAPETIQNIKEPTHEKILSEPEKKKDISQQEQKAHSPIAETVETPAEHKAEKLAHGTSALPSQKVLQPFGNADFLDDDTSPSPVKAFFKDAISNIWQGNKAEKTGDEAYKAKKLAEYMAIIRAIIENNKEYPAFAKQLRLQGTVIVRVSIYPNGRIKNVDVITTSGHKSLDKSALGAVKASEPFKPPANYGLLDVTVDIPITFKLTERR